MNSLPGQLLFVGFPGTSAPDVVLARAREGRVGGVVLFRHNVESPEQARALVASLHAAAPPGTPLLVTVDQEGGRVQRLRAPWTEWPPMRRVAEQGDPAATAALAAALARELLDLGIEPRLRARRRRRHQPREPGDRRPQLRPRRPSRSRATRRAFIAALQAGGVAACAKHFPGHGDTAQDSHHELPRLRPRSRAPAARRAAAVPRRDRGRRRQRS